MCPFLQMEVIGDKVIVQALSESLRGIKTRSPLCLPWDTAIFPYNQILSGL